MRPDLDPKRLKLQGPFPDACFDQSKALFLQFTPVTEMQWEKKIANLLVSRVTFSIGCISSI